MIRSPILCDMFQKEERRRFETELLEKRLEDSIHILRQYNFKEENAQLFVQNLHNQVYAQINDAAYRDLITSPGKKRKSLSPT